MTPIHLLAEDEPHSRLISALAQDAILSSDDVSLDDGTAALLLSRYRWEAPAGPMRVRSLLVVRNVRSASRMRWPQRPTPLALLAIRADGSQVRLDFADGVSLRLQVERLRLSLEDIGDPWRVRHAPRHEVRRLG